VTIGARGVVSNAAARGARGMAPLARRGVLSSLVAASVAAASLAGCRDVSGFNTGPNSRFEGAVVGADFVRTGVDAGTTLCLTLDTDHLQDAPGALSTSDGRFGRTPMRPIPQIWHDPLSTLSFGDGRFQNLIYVVSAVTPFSDGGGTDVFAVVSLMQNGGVEVRLLRGAPYPAAADGATVPESPVFAVFSLARKDGPCAY
jgi:hypothetical protein